MESLICKDVTITWKTKNNINSIHNVDVYEEDSAYRIYYHTLKGGISYMTNKRIWKKNVISIKGKDHLV